MQGLSLVVASGGHSSSQCAGLSLSRPPLLLSTGSRRAGSVIVAHGPSCSAACGIFPVQGSNPCPLHWQADSQPLRHQGSPEMPLILKLQSDIMKLNILKVLTNEIGRAMIKLSLPLSMRIKLDKIHVTGVSGTRNQAMHKCYS